MVSTTLSAPPVEKKPLPEIMTVAEAAEWLRVCRSTLYARMDSGALKYIRFGRLRRLRREDVEQYVEASLIGG